MALSPPLTSATPRVSCRPLRLAYFVESYPLVSETFVLNEVLELHRRGHTVTVFALDTPETIPTHPGAAAEANRVILLSNHLNSIPSWKWRLARMVRRDARNVYALGKRMGPRYAWLSRYAEILGRLLRKGNYDLLHAHFAAPGAEWACLAAHIAGIPFTFTAHRRDIFDAPPPAFQAISESAAITITVSHFNKHYIHSQFSINLDHIRVIPCGLDTDFFQPPNISPPPPDSIFQLVTVARLAPEKDLATLLHAYAELRRRGLKFKAIIVGDGPKRNPLLALRSQLGLCRTVDFRGALGSNEVRNLLRSSTIFCLSSISEGLPLAYMEAMASGLPVVGTDVQGVSELIRHGETGYLVPSQQPFALADATEALMSDHQQAQRMGAAGRLRVLEHFSIGRQIDDLLSVWQEIRKSPR